MAKKILRAYFDQAVAPPSFDICTFLYLAEMERLYLRCDEIDLYVVANTKDGFRDDFKFQPIEDNIRRLQHIVIPAHRLLPSCRRALFFPDRNEAKRDFDPTVAIFPVGYTVDHPTIQYLDSDVILARYANKPFGSLRAPPDAVKLMTQWIDSHLGGRHPVVITLRESHLQRRRNSKLVEWVRFARSLDAQTYAPVFVPDTASIFRPRSILLRDFLVCDAAALDIQLRLALYEAAYINLHVDSGPAVCCMLDDITRTIRFKLDPYGNPTIGARNFLRRGYEKGMQWINCTSHQISIWEPDRCDVITEAFDFLLKRIESGEPIKRVPLPPVTKTVSCFIAGSNFQDAIRLADMKLAADTDNIELKFLRATALKGSMDFDRAILAYEELARIPHARSAVIIPLATCMRQAGATDDAISLLTSAANEEAPARNLLFSIADLLLDMKVQVATLTVITRIMHLDATNPTVGQQNDNDGTESHSDATDLRRLVSKALNLWPNCDELHTMMDDLLDRSFARSQVVPLRSGKS